MDFGAITALLEGFDPAALIPELDTFLGRLELVVRICVMAGPLLLLAFGLWYFFKPPKEANHRAGFCALWGMGSVKAWRYTQWLAGLCFMVLGAVLTVIMLLISAGFRTAEAVEMVSAAGMCLLWQVILVVLCCVGINIAVAVRFDWQGNERKGK